ncbi:MAG TPA: hypothetical protein VF221_20345 [Chloroflexota bacterium]
MGSSNRDLTVAYRLSAALAVLLFMASIVGLFVPGVYRDPLDWADEGRRTSRVYPGALPRHVAQLED